MVDSTAICNKTLPQAFPPELKLCSCIYILKYILDLKNSCSDLWTFWRNQEGEISLSYIRENAQWGTWNATMKSRVAVTPQSSLTLPSMLCFQFSLCVRLSAELWKISWLDFHETWWKGTAWVNEEGTKFWNFGNPCMTVWNTSLTVF